MLALVLKDQKIFLLAINSLKQNLKHYSGGRGTFRLQSLVKIADFLEKKLLKFRLKFSIKSSEDRAKSIGGISIPIK